MNTIEIKITSQLAPRISPQEGFSFPPQVNERLRNLSPWAQQLPAIMRFGEGSLAQQIATRTYLDETDGAHPWREPFYAHGALPPPVAAGEEIMWAAALGEGPGGVTRIFQNGASLSVDDGTIRALAANLPTASGIVSTAEYFPFKTGDWSDRQTDGLAVGVKPTKPQALRQRSRPGAGRKFPKPKNPDSVNVRYALYWFLGFNYDYWPSGTEMEAGIPTPPTNMGISGGIIERAKAALWDYVLEGVAA
jgi:hypothetical protein